MKDRTALIEIVREKALQIGSFTLASGKQASFYLDCRRVTLDATGARLVGEAIFDELRSDLPAAVGGMAIGADPITGAVITMAGLQGVALRGFIVRKEPKQHGTGRQVEGPVEAGEDVVILEDVVTTGGSSLQAIEACEAFGLKVRRVLAIVDRLEGAGEAFAERGYPFQALLSISDLGIDRRTG